MKQLALIILILLTLASCKKESLPQGRFTATTEGCAIKTALNSDGHSLVWQDGDQIKVASSDGQSYLYDLTDNQGSRAGFEYLGVGADPLLTPPYKAGYPPAIWDETCTTVTLPQIQHYKPGSLDQFPMYATSNTDALPFKNLCGVVKLLVNPANAIIYRIDIQANQNISGQFSVAMNNNVPQLTSTTQGSNTVTLLFDTPQTLTASTPIYIYLPEGDYSSFNITLTSSNFLCATKRANQAISIQRNGITTINLSSSTLNFSPNAPEGAIPGYFTHFCKICGNYFYRMFQFNAKIFTVFLAKIYKRSVFDSIIDDFQRLRDNPIFIKSCGVYKLKIRHSYPLHFLTL